MLNARHSAPSPHGHIPQVLVSTHPLLCCGCCGKKWICHAHTSLLPCLPQPTRNSELSCCCCSRNAVEVCGHILARMFLYQTRLVATRRDQTQRDQTRPDQTRPDSCQSALLAGRRSRHPLLPACCHSQRFRFWQFVSNLALIFHTGHRKLKCSHNGKSLACQKWRLRERKFTHFEGLSMGKGKHFTDFTLHICTVFGWRSSNAIKSLLVALA